MKATHCLCLISAALLAIYACNPDKLNPDASSDPGDYSGEPVPPTPNASSVREYYTTSRTLATSVYDYKIGNVTSRTEYTYDGEGLLTERCDYSDGILTGRAEFSYESKKAFEKDFRRRGQSTEELSCYLEIDYEYKDDARKYETQKLERYYSFGETRKWYHLSRTVTTWQGDRIVRIEQFSARVTDGEPEPETPGSVTEYSYTDEGTTTTKTVTSSYAGGQSSQFKIITTYTTADRDLPISEEYVYEDGRSSVARFSYNKDGLLTKRYVEVTMPDSEPIINIEEYYSYEDNTIISEYFGYNLDGSVFSHYETGMLLEGSFSYSYETPVDDTGFREAWPDPSGAEGSIALLCRSLPPLNDVTSNGYAILRSDETIAPATQFPTFATMLKTGTYDAGTKQIATIWSNCYHGIYLCNRFLKMLSLHPDAVGDRSYAEGVARFARAYCYFCLFRDFGPVYIQGDEVEDFSGYNHLDNESVRRATVEEMTGYIVSEMTAAAEMLPWELTEAQIANLDTYSARITRGAALAVKAKTLLTAASPLYGSRDIVDSHLFPDRGASRWDEAARAYKELIDAGRYSLVTDASPDLMANYLSVFHDNWNRETILGWVKRKSDEYGYLNGNEMLALCLPPANNLWQPGFSLAIPSLRLADAFPMMQSGKYPVIGYGRSASGDVDYSKPSIDVSSGYGDAEYAFFDYELAFQDDYARSQGWAAPEFQANMSTAYRDPRYYATLVPNGFPMPVYGKGYVNMYLDHTPDSPVRWSRDAMSSGYVWRKWYLPDYNLSSTSGFRDIQEVFPAIRYAEILLDYAEICLELGNLAEACMYLNMTRSRVGLPYMGYRGTDDLRMAIRMERLCEFSGEGVHHYDEIRWGTAEENYNAEPTTLSLDTTQHEYSYKRTNENPSFVKSVFRRRDYLLPIPASVIQEYPWITQNPGW